MRVVHLSTELAPIAKVGGLGDVVYGLSKELCRQHHTVEIILPKYDTIDYSKVQDLHVECKDLWLSDGPYKYNNTIWSALVENLRVYLVEPHHPSYYFSRGSIYGAYDDIDRFLYFTRAAMEFLCKTNRSPDCIHAHDWATALAAPLYYDMYKPLGMRVGGVLLTIHNLEHQGKCGAHNLSRIGLRGEDYLTPEKMQDPYSPTNINLLKGGIEYADAVTTVSPNYEKEIETPEGGCGLHLVLQRNHKKIKGILNGIDEDFWDPRKDIHLIQKYDTHAPISKEKIEQILCAKAENKKQLRGHLGLEERHAPLVGCVARLVHQKAPHLIIHAMRRTLSQGGQFALLGSIHSAEMQKLFTQVKEEFSSSKNVSISLDKDEALAHLIFASSDFFIIPSLFEPCGLTQLIALRYASIPIARKTGGLADTVFDIDTSPITREKRNGFVFDHPDEEGINWALDRALALWKKDKRDCMNLCSMGQARILVGNTLLPSTCKSTKS